MFLDQELATTPYEEDSRRLANVHSISNQDYITYMVKYVGLKLIKTSED